MVPYFDLESFPGVAELKRQKDANSEAIRIPRGIILGDRIVTAAYVSTLVVFPACVHMHVCLCPLFWPV